MWKIKLFIVFLIVTSHAYAQNTYQYKRKITGVQTTWHNLVLPDHLYKNIQRDLQDIRILGIRGKDTIEVPYLLKQKTDQISQKEVNFKLINQSAATEGYYFTFQMLTPTAINQIILNFKQTNFDWRLSLEGSIDNKEWFSILNDYRILSIKNQDTNYQFTRLGFPDAQYGYFRVRISSSKAPVLKSARILQTDTVKGMYKEIKYASFQVKNNPKTKESTAEIVLKEPLPVSSLKIPVNSNFDYYRNFHVEYATDSFKTDRGLQYNYTDLYDGVISSSEIPVFSFPNIIASRLRITIQNNDNRPLLLHPPVLKGSIYEITARFDDPTGYDYALYYGNQAAIAPNYEIAQFKDKVPEGLAAVQLGAEEQNPAFRIEKSSPLFENKAWLWAIMAVIIALLGWFSYKMLQKPTP